MTLDRRAGAAGQFCSVFSENKNEDPGGSAPSWKRCVIVEVEKPWEKEVAESRHFPPAVSEALGRAEQRGVEVKLHCVAPDKEYSVEGSTRVIYCSRPDGPFAGFNKDEFVVPSDQVGPLVESLLDGSDAPRSFEPYRQDTSKTRDILVCTHGSHDTCCASFGYPIYHFLRFRYAPELSGALRVWRVSHLGGHRFAPNLVDMPEGRNWVRLGRDALEALVYRNRPVSTMKQHYRGWVGLDSPFEQAAEREVFAREGWGWVRRAVSGRTTADDGERAEVRIEFASLEGTSSGAYDATVERSGTAPRIDCLTGRDSGDVPQLTVSKLAKAPRETPRRKSPRRKA